MQISVIFARARCGISSQNAKIRKPIEDAFGGIDPKDREIGTFLDELF